MTDASRVQSERTAVRSAYDGLAAEYDAAYDDEVCAAEDRAVERVLRPMVRAARSVLDVGCGTGWVLDHANGLLAAGRRKYSGFDLSEGMLARLREKHRFDRVTVWQGDLNDSSNWQAPDRRQYVHQLDRYDLVVSTFASPSYATSVDEFVERCGTHLNPGGRLLLMPHARGAERREAYMHDPDAYVGDVPWGERRTRDALERAGFVDVEVTGLRHPEFGPGLHRGRLWHDAWLQLEPRLFRPDSTSFLIVKARLA